MTVFPISRMTDSSFGIAAIRPMPALKCSSCHLVGSSVEHLVGKRAVRRIVLALEIGINLDDIAVGQPVIIPVAHPLILRTDGVVVRHTAFHNALVEIPALVVPAVVVRPEHQSPESHEPLLIVIADSRPEKIPLLHNVAKHGCHTKE